MVSGFGGEARFASAVARRLESLGALTKGDRTATVGEGFGLSSFEFDNNWGRLAVGNLFTALKSRNRHTVLSVSMLQGFEENFIDEAWLQAIEDLDDVIKPTFGDQVAGLTEEVFQSRQRATPGFGTMVELLYADYNYKHKRLKVLRDWEAKSFSRKVTQLDDAESRAAVILQARADGLSACHVIASWVPKMGVVWKDFGGKPNGVAKFLNRILGLPLVQQNILFALFEECVSDVIKIAIEEGKYEVGITTMKGAAIDFHSTPPRSFMMGGKSCPDDIVNVHTVYRDTGISYVSLITRRVELRAAASKEFQGLQTELAKEEHQRRWEDEGFYVSKAALRRTWDKRDPDRFRKPNRCPPKLYYAAPERKRGSQVTMRRLNPATGEDSLNLSNFLDDCIHIKRVPYINEALCELWWKEEYKASDVVENSGIGANISRETKAPLFGRYWGNRRARNRTDFILTGDLCPILSDFVKVHSDLKGLHLKVQNAIGVVRVEAPSKPALSDDFMDVDSDSDDDSNRSANTSASTSAGPAVGTSASFRAEEEMEIEHIMAEFAEMDGDEIIGCNIARNFKGVGIFRGEVVEFDDVHDIWCCLVCGQIFRLPLKSLAEARHLFIHERKLLVKAGFSLKAASSVKTSLVDHSKLGERPRSINDGVLMPKDGHRAHENFELMDPAGSGVDLQPGELVGFKIESRIITHPLSLSVKKKGEEIPQMQQIEVLLSTLASSFHGISRASLVEGGEEAEEAELRGYSVPKKKKVKMEEGERGV